MNRALWWTLFLALAIAVVLGGSAAITGAEGGPGAQPGRPVELTEFPYLPVVIRSPPVWFVKSPASPLYEQNFANDAGCNANLLLFYFVQER